MGTPHKHAELIKAWADGAEIQIYDADRCEFVDLFMSQPNWDVNCKYRIKPAQKPDVVYYLNATIENCTHSSVGSSTRQLCCDNLKLTFDGETGKLKSAEVL